LEDVPVEAAVAVESSGKGPKKRRKLKVLEDVGVCCGRVAESEG